VGCYSSSPLKQNLVPRFLSVVVRGAETKLELGHNGCSSNPPVILWMVALPTHRWYFELHQGLSFAKGVDRLQLLKLMAEELMLPKVSSQNLVGTFLRLAGLGYLVYPERFFESPKVFSSQIEVLKSRGFSGSFCCLGGCRFLRVDWWSLQFLVLRLEAWCWCRPLILSLQSFEDGRCNNSEIVIHLLLINVPNFGPR
jgi:hypothetical protein